MRVQGVVTRGTTGVNRLRRLDRWLTGPGALGLRRADDPLVVDLGFGAHPVTTMELAARLRRVRGDVRVVGVEIDAERVRRARELAQVHGVGFIHGGFELSGLEGEPVVVRAANVLRQYPVTAVPPAWERLAERMAPGGLIVDATCDEIGRRAAWLAVAVGDDAGVRPVSLTLSMHLGGLQRPSVVAERLPKALIHRNVRGEGVHAWLTALDTAWARHAPLATFGARQRFVASCATVAEMGWPVIGGPTRWRLGEVSVAASAVL